MDSASANFYEILAWFMQQNKEEICKWIFNVKNEKPHTSKNVEEYMTFIGIQ